MNAISAYPLQWPAEWPRATSRKRAKFGTGERVHSQYGGSWISKKSLTIAEAMRRVMMAIDLYDRVADNLAAVAATLSAMRAIERHGGAQILERAFTGFDALPAAEPHWSETLKCARDSGIEEIERAWRAAAKSARPDAGGSHDAMARINAAREAAHKERAQ